MSARMPALVTTTLVALQVLAQPLFVPANGSPVSVPRGPNNVLIAEINNDSRPDIVVASSTSRAITVLLGRGDGTFSPVIPTPRSVTDPPNEIAAGDINGDRHVDLAVASHDSYDIVLLLGDGRGGFTPAATSPVRMKTGKQPHTHGLLLVDVNNDRKLDLVSANSNDDNDLAIALGDGAAGFTQAKESPFSVAASPYPFAGGDLNHDGNLDFVVSSSGLGTEGAKAASPSRALTALFGDGRGGLRRADIAMRTSRTWFVAIADVNRDRHPDVVATHTEERYLSVLMGDGTGTFREVAGSPFSIGHSAWYTSLADFTGDDIIDIAVAADTSVRVLRGDGRGAFVADEGLVFPVGKGAWRLAVGDLNGDGRLDVVTPNLESNTISVLLGRNFGRR